MFSPSELEGEVDHAFFDSDCEDVRGEKGKKADSNLTTTNISPTSNKMPPKPAPDDNKRVSEKGTVKNSANDNCDNEEDEKSSKPFMTLLAVANGYESEEDVRYSRSKIKNEQENKKRISHTLHPPSVSSEANCDTKDPSKTSSSGFRGGTDSETSENSHNVSSDECDDTVTDVSPLSSPTSSRLQSLDLNHSETEEDKGVPSSGCSSAQHQECFSQEEDDYSLNSMRRFEGKVDMTFPSSRHRKNYSFTNSEVQRIDRDNQRLLRQLSRFSTGSRPGSVQGQIRSVTSSTPVNRFPHSAINRQREQQRIERDNIAFLKRLESVKPTPGMKRSEQLADYQRQVGYLGMCPVYQITGKKFLGKGCIQNKAPNHSARATSTTTEPSCAPTPRPRKTKAAQPTWC